MDFVRTLIAKTYPSEWEGVPMLTVSSLPQDAVALVFKRAIDLAGSSFALLIFGPVILLAAALVKLTSRGPAFFVQDRVGRNGRIFRYYKIRTMYEGADLRKAELAMQIEVSGPVFKMHRDPRVTPVGQWLRKFSIDETPQFWNVLKGDMSLVGPRPPGPSEVQKYERWQRRRLSMKPGLTCIWQVSGRSTIAFEDWMKLDLDYIDNWSLKMDLIILARTVPAVLSAKGAH